MYGELASVKGVVDLSPQDALDNAHSFLGQLGYTLVQRTDTSLTVKRQSQEEQDAEQNALTLTVVATPQPEGGTRIKVNGNDQEGVQEQQAAWIEWSENLPKRPEIHSDELEEDQPQTIQAPNDTLLRLRIAFANSLSALKSAVGGLAHGSRTSPTSSRGLLPNPVLSDILLGVLLAFSVVILLVVLTYVFLALRGALSTPSVPWTLGLVILALLHGGGASLTVPPIPSLLGVGGSVELGLPVSSFALLPLVLLLLASRYVAQRVQTAAIFAVSVALSYGVIVGLFAALGSGSVETAEGVTVEFAADPISTAMRALIWAGIGAMVGAAVPHGPLLPVRVRQVIRGSLAAVGISVGLTLLLAVIAALLSSLLGGDGPVQQAPDWPPLGSESGPTGDAPSSPGNALGFLGALIALLPWFLGTLWLLAHGVPVGFQDTSSLSQLPFIGPALADVPLRVSLLGTWPWGAAWRLLLLGPIVGLIVGGMLATRGSPRTDRWWQGALVAVPYALIALLVAFFARLTADLTLAVATLSITLGASLPWLLFLLPAGGALGALGGYIVKDSDKEVSAAHPRRTFLLTGIICAVVLVLSLPSLMISGPAASEELASSSVLGADSPLEPPLSKTAPTQGDNAAPGKLDIEAPPSNSKSSSSDQARAERPPIGLGEPVTVGEMEWLVTAARRENQVTPSSGEALQGDFMIVDFELTNNSDEQVRLYPSSFSLIGSQGRRFEIISNMSRYVPSDRRPFSQPIAPGANQTERIIFEVEPRASGFRLQLGDGRQLPQENGYVDLGS